MRRFSRYLFLFLFIALIAIQFIEVDRTNPGVTAEIRVSEEIKRIFKNACYDCHSNETKWPWYSYVAPISLYIAGHVKDGRKDLNFSEWEKLSSSKKIKLQKEIWEEIEKDKMPMKIYTYIHPKAVLDLYQKNIIKQWASRTRVWN